MCKYTKLIKKFKKILLVFLKWGIFKIGEQYMRKRKLLYFFIPLVIVFIIGLAFYFKTDNAQAAYSHNFERVETYEDTDGKTVYVYDFYVELTQNSTFNHVEASFETVGLEILDFEIKEDFVTESLDLGSGDGGSFSLTSNTIYTSDTGKVVYATITVKATGTEDCFLRFIPSPPQTVNTNDVDITKTALATQESSTPIREVEDNETFYYKILLENNSPIPTDNLVVTDRIPDEFEILNAYTGNVSGQNITWNIDSMDVGETIELFVQVRVKEDFDRTDFTITNTATVTINGEEKSDDATVEILQPDLTITKEASVNVIKPGEEFSYTITVTNRGEGTAKNVVVFDDISRYFTIVNSSIFNSGSGNSTRFVIGDLAYNESASITIIVRVNYNAPFDTIDNIAIARADNNDRVDDNDTVVISDSNLTITKTATKNELRPGEEFTYNIVITNEGDTSSNPLTVTDIIDSRLEIVSAPEANINGQQVSWSLSSLASSRSQTYTITVRVRDNVATGSNIPNVAILEEKGKADKQDDEDITVVDSNVTISKTASKNEVKPGEEFEYYIDVVNNGDVPSRDLTITDVIDSRLEIVRASGASINGQTITWHISSLDPSESERFTVVVRVKSDVANNTVINNVVTLREPGKPDQTDDEDVTVKKPILNITKVAYNDEGEKTIAPGEEYYYQITVTNTGSIASGLITITDNINSLLTIVDSDGGTLNGNRITWTIDSLPTSGNITYTVKVRLSTSATSGTSIPNTAVLTHEDETLEDDDTVEVVDSDVYLLKRASQEVVHTGEEFYYTITIGNNGTNAAENLVLTDSIPEKLELLGVEYTNGNTSHNISGNNMTVNISELAVNETINLTVRVKVRDNVVMDEVILNKAILTYDDKTKTSEDDVIVVDSNLTVDKVSSKDKVLNTEHFFYTITVSNTGTYQAENVQVVDTYDENLTIVSCDNCVASNNTLTWDVGTIAVGESVTFTVEAYIENQDSGYIINNEVVVKEPGKPDITDEVDVEVVDYIVTISKEVSASEVLVGQEFKYYIHIKNESAIAIQNIKVSDVIDERLIIIDSGNALMNGNTIEWEFSLLANEEKVIEITVMAKEGTQPGEEIPNTAILTVDDEDTPSNEVIVKIVEEVIENPKTGSKLNYFLLTIGLVSVVGIAIYTKKHKTIYKL